MVPTEPGGPTADAAPGALGRARLWREPEGPSRPAAPSGLICVAPEAGVFRG